MNQICRTLNRSHADSNESFEEKLKELKNKISLRGNLPHVSVARQLDIIDQFLDFPLGRFIIDKRGANGFWTDYMVSHPFCRKDLGLNIEGVPLSTLENWFLNQCPIVIAHQERFLIFQKLAQNLLRNDITLASIPCGLMRDLIDLDFSEITNFQLIGVDIDSESLILAERLAHQRGIQNIKMMQQDAWELPFRNEIDVITSSGLNVYESDNEKVLELYYRLFAALKPGGHLIISVLTYPPGEDRETDWNIEGISEETLLLDRILHKDILDIKWRNFRSSSEITDEFKQVGFTDVSVHFDKHRIFPTILAKKPILLS